MADSPDREWTLEMEMRHQRRLWWQVRLFIVPYLAVLNTYLLGCWVSYLWQRSFTWSPR